MISSSIFKSYDIRGIYPAELNKEAAFAIGAAFVQYTGSKTIAIGQDMRLSSPDLFEGLYNGVVQSGCNVVNLGQIPTEMLYFAVGNKKYDAGIMITASHNPKEYNGFKLIKKDKEGFSMVRGQDLLTLAIGNKQVLKEKRGSIKNIDLKEEYINYILSLFDSKKIKPLRVVFDAGNGMASTVLSILEKKIAIKSIPLNFKIDGNFPNHASNPLEGGAIDQLSVAIKKEKADMGFIFDGDSDRIFLLDEKGGFVAADMTFLLLAKYTLSKNPRAGIVYNTICSKAVPETINRLGGRAIKSKVGFVNVREAAIKQEGILGGELSGHYCFRENYYGDSSLIALLILLEAISSSNKKVSELISECVLYQKASEINFKVDNKDLVLNKIKEKYSDAKQEYLDGVTVEYEDWWFNLRPSNTEPLLRLTIEADSKGFLEEKKKEITDFINSL